MNHTSMQEQQKTVLNYAVQFGFSLLTYAAGVAVAGAIGGPVGAFAGAVLQKSAIAAGAAVVTAACADVRTAAHDNIVALGRSVKQTVDKLLHPKAAGKEAVKIKLQALPTLPTQSGAAAALRDDHALANAFQQHAPRGLVAADVKTITAPAVQTVTAPAVKADSPKARA
jgi:hypothetical protein